MSYFKFGVGNYRIFEDFCEFDFSPITILTGPNNSGKSSLVKALKLIGDSTDAAEIPNELNFNLNSHGLNSYKDIISNEKLGLSNSYTIHSDFFGEGRVFVSYRGNIEDNSGFNLNSPYFFVQLHFKEELILEYHYDAYTLYDFKINLKLLIDFVVERLDSVVTFYEGNPIWEISSYLLEKNLVEMFWGIEASDQSKIDELNKQNEEDFGEDSIEFEFNPQFEELISSDEWKILKKYFEDLIDANLERNDSKIDRVQEMIIQLKEGQLFNYYADDDVFNESLIKRLNKIQLRLIEELSENSKNKKYEDLQISTERYRFNKSKSIAEDVSTFVGEVIASFEEQLVSLSNDDIQNRISESVSTEFIVNQVFKEDFKNAMKPVFEKIRNINAIPFAKFQNERFISFRQDASFFGEVVRIFFISEKARKRGELFASPFFEQPYLNYWLEKFEIGKSLLVESIEDELLSVKLESFSGEFINVDNMGTGVRQVLSVILSPLKVFSVNDDLKMLLHGYKNKGLTFYLEEPESNLHPNWQSLLMELVVDIQEQFGINFIIETHSEYMIRKLQSLVSKDKKKKDLAKIYYFRSNKDYTEDRDPEKERFYEIEIDENGLLSRPFGPGFFDESGNLTLEVIKNHPNYN